MGDLCTAVCPQVGNVDETHRLLGDVLDRNRRKEKWEIGVDLPQGKRSINKFKNLNAPQRKAPARRSSRVKSLSNTYFKCDYQSFTNSSKKAEEDRIFLSSSCEAPSPEGYAT